LIKEIVLQGGDWSNENKNIFIKKHRNSKELKNVITEDGMDI